MDTVEAPQDSLTTEQLRMLKDFQNREEKEANIEKYPVEPLTSMKMNKLVNVSPCPLCGTKTKFKKCECFGTCLDLMRGTSLQKEDV